MGVLVIVLATTVTTLCSLRLQLVHIEGGGDVSMKRKLFHFWYKQIGSFD